MVPMARILVVGVVFIAAPCAFAELKPTRQPISAIAAARANFMSSPFCVSLRRPGEPVGRASPATDLQREGSDPARARPKTGCPVSLHGTRHQTDRNPPQAGVPE